MIIPLKLVYWYKYTQQHLRYNYGIKVTFESVHHFRRYARELKNYKSVEITFRKPIEENEFQDFLKSIFTNGLSLLLKKYSAREKDTPGNLLKEGAYAVKRKYINGVIDSLRKIEKSLGAKEAPRE